MKLKSYENIGEQVYSQVLPNGLTVNVIPKPGFSKSYAFFATNYGGADRRFRLGGKWIDTPEGVAHFLEHKMFDTKDGNALSMLSGNGASPNAFTSSDITAYHFQCTEKFYENLRILLSFVSVPYFTEESVRKEQGIIGQEIRMTEDEPGSVIYYNLMKCLYEHNPIRYSVAGTVESIAEITPQTLYDCHKVFYNPSNMVLCVEGDVDPDKIVEMCLEILPKEPGEVPVRDYGPTGGQSPYMSRLEQDMQISQKQFFIGCRAKPMTRGKSFLTYSITGDLALSILFGKSSRLYTKLYTDGVINSEFDAGFETVAGVGHCMIAGEGANPDEILANVMNESSLAAKNGVDDKIFRRVKKAAYGNILRKLNAFDSTCYAYAYGYFNGYDEFDTASVLESITANDVNTFIRDNIRPENMAISIINPKN